jgi:hypothetical protein
LPSFLSSLNASISLHFFLVVIFVVFDSGSDQQKFTFKSSRKFFFLRGKLGMKFVRLRIIFEKKTEEKNARDYFHNCLTTRRTTIKASQ